MNKDLKLEPHHLKGRPGIWWYEVPRGIKIYVRDTTIDHPSNLVIFKIDWVTLRNALKRKDKGRR